jgi:hypothetical protein
MNRDARRSRVPGLSSLSCEPCSWWGCGLPLATTLVACGSKHQPTTQARAEEPQPFTVAHTKRVFAAAGIALHQYPGLPPNGTVTTRPRAMLMAVLRRPRLTSIEVLVYRSVREVAGVLHPKTPVIITQHATTVRRGNVLIVWVGRENPRVAAALSRLR